MNTQPAARHADGVPCTRMSLFAPLLALVVLAAAIPARADVKLDENGKLKFTGDFRFRLERDWDSMQSSGIERDNRDRARIRLRLGFTYEPNSHVKLVTRARTGNTNGQQSGHVTIIQAGDNGDADILVDRAFLQFGWKDGFARLGRTGHPFWRQDELLFDDDVWFDGVSFQFRAGGNAASHEVNGMFAAVPEGEASLALDEQGWISGLQYAVHRHFPSGDLSVGAGLYRTQDDTGVLNPVLLDLDALTAAVSVHKTFVKPKIPIAVGVDLMENLDGPPDSVFNHGETTAWSVNATFGKPVKANDWLVAWTYAHVEKYALVPFLAQDDWLRWGSGTQTRSSNFEGHELRFVWQFTKWMNVMTRLYIVDALELESAAAVAREDGNRLRIDLNMKW